VKKYREDKKQRYLSPAELKRLTAAIAEAERQATIAKPMATALRLLILTGCRLNEILSLRWSAVDFESGVIMLEQHKTDRNGPKAIPLSKAAVRVLRRAERVLVGASVHYHSTTKTMASVSLMTPPLRRPAA
jgi:integrase